MIKDVHEYMTTSYHTMDYYCDDKSIFYFVAFAFLAFLYLLFGAACLLVMFITAPVWVGPYLIYLKLKERKRHD